jgi:4,5-dihydroxyphthalate decarboxylase
MLPWMLAENEEVSAVFGDECWPYGLEPNRPTLEAMVRYLVEQGIIAKAPRIDELFVRV